MRALMSKNVSSTWALGDVVLAQQLVVDAVELALPHGARRLQLVHRARPADPPAAGSASSISAHARARSRRW